MFTYTVLYFLIWPEYFAMKKHVRNIEEVNEARDLVVGL